MVYIVTLDEDTGQLNKKVYKERKTFYSKKIYRNKNKINIYKKVTWTLGRLVSFVSWDEI